MMCSTPQFVRNTRAPTTRPVFCDLDFGPVAISSTVAPWPRKDNLHDLVPKDGPVSLEWDGDVILPERSWAQGFGSLSSCHAFYGCQRWLELTETTDRASP